MPTTCNPVIQCGGVTIPCCPNNPIPTTLFAHVVIDCLSYDDTIQLSFDGVDEWKGSAETTCGGEDVKIDVRFYDIDDPNPCFWGFQVKLDCGTQWTDPETVTCDPFLYSFIGAEPDFAGGCVCCPSINDLLDITITA